ncbi:hypothetical protein CSE45_1735 [Citreicella sp. SE45]|nr:hypothetical protein CSE45_1735 [Citreicella sp. SE45]
MLALPLEAFFDEQTDIGTDDELLLRDTRTVAMLLRSLSAERRSAIIDLLRAMAAE